MLDVGVLGKAEGESWGLKDINCLQPEERRCLISLSNGAGRTPWLADAGRPRGATRPGRLPLRRPFVLPVEAVFRLSAQPPEAAAAVSGCV